MQCTYTILRIGDYANYIYNNTLTSKSEKCRSEFHYIDNIVCLIDETNFYDENSIINGNNNNNGSSSKERLRAHIALAAATKSASQLAPSESTHTHTKSINHRERERDVNFNVFSLLANRNVATTASATKRRQTSLHVFRYMYVWN